MAGSADRIRIVVVDGSESFLVGLRNWVSGQPSLSVVGTAPTGEDADTLVQRARPDLVLMEAVLPGIDGFETTRGLKSRPDAPVIVVLTLHDSRAARHEAWAAGADGFVAKGDLAEELMPLIQTLFPGRAGADDETGPGAGRIADRAVSERPATPRADGAAERRRAVRWADAWRRWSLRFAPSRGPLAALVLGTALGGLLAGGGIEARTAAGDPGERAPQPNDTAVAVEAVRGNAWTRVGGETVGVPRRLTAADALPLGSDLVTQHGRVALHLPSGHSLRMDISTQIRFLDAGAIRLDRGAVYVEAGPSATALEVRTELGVVRETRARYEVRVEYDTLRVRVRDGSVLVRGDGGRTREVLAGSEVLFDPPVTEIPRAVAVDGPEWEWVASIAPQTREGNGPAR